MRLGNSSGVRSENSGVKMLTGDERVGRPGSIFSLPGNDARHKLDKTKGKTDNENRKQTIKTEPEEEESFSQWKGWKGAQEESNESRRIETNQETDNAHHPYKEYMKQPTGNIFGSRSQNIKKNLTKLQQIIRANSRNRNSPRWVHAG